MGHINLTDNRVNHHLGKLQELTLTGFQEAKFLYTSIYDYCTYAADPQYQRLHKYRNQISKLAGRDRDILIAYFNADPAIAWTGIPQVPYLYYAKDYYDT